MSSPIALAPLAVSISSLPRTFHPTLTVQLDIPQSSQFVPGAQCQAILRLPLPDAVFVDPDELHGRWGPRGLLLNEQADVVTEGRASGTADVRRALGWALSPRDIDIERPVRPPHTPSRDGKGAPRRQDVASVLWLSVPIDAHDEGLDERECEGQTITVEIPLHGRYLVPNDAGSVNITLFDNAPSVQDATGALQAGWTCEHIALTPPLGRYDMLDILLPTVPIPTPITLTLPTGHPSHQLPVEIVTAVAIWLGWAYLMRKMWNIIARHKVAVGEVTSQDTLAEGSGQ